MLLHGSVVLLIHQGLEAGLCAAAVVKVCMAGVCMRVAAECERGSPKQAGFECESVSLAGFWEGKENRESMYCYRVRQAE